MILPDCGRSPHSVQVPVDGTAKDKRSDAIYNQGKKKKRKKKAQKQAYTARTPHEGRWLSGPKEWALVTGVPLPKADTPMLPPPADELVLPPPADEPVLPPPADEPVLPPPADEPVLPPPADEPVLPPPADEQASIPEPSCRVTIHDDATPHRPARDETVPRVIMYDSQTHQAAAQVASAPRVTVHDEAVPRALLQAAATKAREKAHAKKTPQKKRWRGLWFTLLAIAAIAVATLLFRPALLKGITSAVMPAGVTTEPSQTFTSAEPTPVSVPSQP